jgi:hypothetical protein
MPRNSSSVDTRTVLKTYNISSTNPKRWQDTSLDRPKQRSNRRQNRYSVLQDQQLDVDEDSTRAIDTVEDEEDALGVINGGIFKYSPQWIGVDIVHYERNLFRPILQLNHIFLHHGTFRQRTIYPLSTLLQRTLSWLLD